MFFLNISQTNVQLESVCVSLHTSQVVLLVLRVPDNPGHPIISYTPHHFTRPTLLKYSNVLPEDEWIFKRRLPSMHF